MLVDEKTFTQNARLVNGLPPCRAYCRMLPLSSTATAAGNASASAQSPTSAPTPDLEGVSQRGGVGDLPGPRLALILTLTLTLSCPDPVPAPDYWSSACRGSPTQTPCVDPAAHRDLV